MPPPPPESVVPSPSSPLSARSHQLVVEKTESGLRLDQFLAQRLTTLSRRRLRVLIDIGGVFVDGARVKQAGRPVRPGQRIEAHVGGALTRATAAVGKAARQRDAETLPAYRIVMEDDDLIVVDKPAGLLTAPTPESDRGNLADLLSRREATPARIFVVHRIDLPTSGLLVFAKTDAANRALSERFRTHDVAREYDAVVAGALPDTVATIDQPLRGKRAVTHVRVAERFDAVATHIRCRLETGRTHQIRLHLQDLGHPVLGDPLVRGVRTEPPAPRMALHATTLGFIHPTTGLPVQFDSPLPSDLALWLADLRARSAATRELSE